MTEHQQVWVFGGGGLGGIAWETGILAGLADEGVTIAPNATILGTSAGSTVAAQVGGGTPIELLYEAQLAGVPYEISKSFGMRGILRLLGLSLISRTPEQFGQRVGAAALAAPVGPAEERLDVIRQRLPNHEWTASDVRIVSVDAVSGATRIFTRADGLPLVDVVAASCAVPLVWPVVQLDGRQWIDGGMRSSLNLDLAPGVGSVVAFAPTPGGFGRWASISRQRSLLAPTRAVEVVRMSDEASKAQGGKSLDKSIVAAVAAAGREQGRRIAPRIAVTLDH